MDLDTEKTVAERVDRLLTHQAGARASLSPDTRKTIRQFPRLSAKSDHDRLRSAGSGMRSGRQPSKLKLTLADTVVAAPTPEEEKAQERVEWVLPRTHEADVVILAD